MASLQHEFNFSGKLPPSAELGMAQADENANQKWKHIWDACVLAAARRLFELTSDDVLEEFEKLNRPPGTHNLSAIGPAMRRAWKMGILKPTSRTVRSKRLEKNGNLHVVWISNYFRVEHGNTFLACEPRPTAAHSTCAPGQYHENPAQTPEQRKGNYIHNSLTR